MKECDRWLNKQTLILNLSQQSKDKMYLAWRAALEWALSHDVGPCSFNRCNVRDIVEEELDSV